MEVVKMGRILLTKMGKGEESNTEVSWEEQNRINTFSRLNARVAVQEAELRQFETEKESMTDAMDEMELNDDTDKARILVGEGFVRMTCGEARGRMEKQRETLEANISALNVSISEARSRLGALKVDLYERFGKSINLDN